MRAVAGRPMKEAVMPLKYGSAAFGCAQAAAMPVTFPNGLQAIASGDSCPRIVPHHGTAGSKP
jgi:hypothetical protein